MAVNEDLIRRTVKAMEENKEMWDQSDWIQVPWESDKPICGTTLCFAGFAMAVLMGAGEFFERALEPDEDGGWQTTSWADGEIEYEAADALGLDGNQAARLFGCTFIDDLNIYKALITQVTGVVLP